MNTCSYAIPAVAALLAFLLGCNARVAKSASSSVQFVVFGDSLTCGGQGNAFGESPRSSVPYLLALLSSGIAINQGVGGNTSQQIAVRNNAAAENQYLSVAGNVIPTSGSVQVFFPSGWEPATIDGGNNGAGCYGGPTGTGTNGVIQNIPGVFTYSGGNYYFTPSQYPSTPVTVLPNTHYTVATPYDQMFMVDASGTNDFHLGIPTISSIIDLDNNIVSRANNNYIVTSALPFAASDYWPGTANATALSELNAARAATFKTHYADTLTPLLQGCGPIAGSSLAKIDAIDITHGLVPASCRSYDAGNLLEDISETQTSLCVTGAQPAAEMIGYLSSTVQPYGSAEAIKIIQVSTPGRCGSGYEIQVTRGYAGTVPQSYRAGKDYWGCWSDVHLSGGDPDTRLAAKTGYSIQAAAIYATYQALTAQNSE